MNDGRVVSNFIIQALQGKPITIYGAGNQTRSFQYVSDLVDGLISLMNSNSKHKSSTALKFKYYGGNWKCSIQNIIFTSQNTRLREKL